MEKLKNVFSVIGVFSFFLVLGYLARDFQQSYFMVDGAHPDIYLVVTRWWGHQYWQIPVFYKENVDGYDMGGWAARGSDGSWYLVCAGEEEITYEKPWIDVTKRRKKLGHDPKFRHYNLISCVTSLK
ncbi:MAG: hypothetical protein ABIN18_29145 [Pseudomonadota bacterium]